MTLTPPSSRTSGTTGTEVLDGGATATILDTDSADLQWARDSGDALLDYTNPAAPTVLETGVYGIQVRVQAQTAITAGGSFEVRLQAGTAVQIRASAPAATGALTTPVVAMTVVAPLVAGESLLARVNNNTGATEDFNLGGGAVTRLS